ncbi:MAG: hypothetical protein HS104_15090 [Polyangiaceae bacterium]|nr:hypothetical protein [Polyangiaceae bacterium]MCL4754721.1 hypothetical protein [Myxococcales bacterium]
MRGLSVVLVLGVLAAGCREPGAAPSPASSAPPNPSASAPPAATTAAPPRPSSPPQSEPEPLPAGSAAPSGGNWLRCYAQFQPRTQPDLDVTRLGLMCGPSNGMRKAAESREATLGEPGKPREHRFKAEPGDCYRIFAVAEPSIEDLDIEVFGPGGNKIAFDTSDDRWPIVKPDGPFCVFEGGEYRAEVRAQRGQGRYSIEIWRLR